MKVFDPQRAEKLTKPYWEGATLQATAQETQLSKQRISQLIARLDPDHSRRDARRAWLAEAARQKQEAEPRPKRPLCEVCRRREILTAARARTCGGECARIWRTISRTIDPDKWREHQLRCAPRPEAWKPRGDRRRRPGSAVDVALERMAELRADSL
jgi:hypothetical protein